MIEPGDINDKEILDKTKIEKHANGTIRFKYDLPDGRTLTSEYFSPDHRRTAIKVWLDTVRANIADAVQALAREKGRAAREAALKAERNKQMDAILEDTKPHPLDDKGLPPAREQDTDCKPPGLTAESDPVQHAKNQVALLESEARHWYDALQRAEKNLRVAQDKLSKWKQIVASFEAGEGND